MLRKIITIDEEKCNGCGLCVDACHEGAIVLEGDKARLVRDDYCDGLGNCLPACPTGAISFEIREAAAFDEEAVKAHMEKKVASVNGCPGCQVQSIEKKESVSVVLDSTQQSELRQWPVQIKLVPVNAPYFKDAKLLIAADCTAFSYGDFHNKFMKNRVTLIGCPKLDMGDYSKKLTEIFKYNDIKSVLVTRMEVPCCGGIEAAVRMALQNSGKMIPWQVVTISTEGEILED
ncbi:MAG: 4Fe-4S dicluster domain-containing protein [Negativicutes bacterium]|nr:4Fe-4S dicluster domain-containing protein [Negativicutes bacterium]